jgi:CheY-like chemotaxis protein
VVVDGYPDAADSLSQLLALWGYTVATAYDGLAALELARTFQPQIVLADLVLPRLDGSQLARQLRVELPHAVLIALTGLGQPADRECSRLAGFHFHIVKPGEPDRLRELLATLASPRAG